MSQEINARVARWVVRALAGVLTLSIVIETIPGQLWGANAVKGYVWPINKLVGLWQGEWPLFAPNPTINNAWISAELRGPDGVLKTWNSPYWATKSSWEKFRHFRMMNYGNRLPHREIIAGQDLADYVVKNEFQLDLEPIESLAAEVSGDATVEQLHGSWQLDLYHNQLKISLPAEGGFPPRDDTTWISTSKKLLTREYQQ